MDPFSLTLGIISLLEALKSSLKLARKHGVGPSALSSVEAENLKKTLLELHGATNNFKTCLDISDDEEWNMASLEYLKPVVERSFESLQIVRDYLGSRRTVKAFRGANFDKKLKVSLKSLDDASKLFAMAVSVDQQ